MNSGSPSFRQTPAPLRLLTFVALLALLWLPPYRFLQRTIADSNTLSILAVSLLFAEFVALLWFWATCVNCLDRPLRHYGLLPTRQNRCELLRGLAVGCLSLLSLFAVAAGLGWLTWQPFSVRLLHIALEGLLVSLGVGLGEELIFRGWLLDELERDYSLALSLWLSSVVYAILHFIKPLQDLLAMLSGAPVPIAGVIRTLPQFPGLVLLGMILVWAKRSSRGRLGLSIGLHAGLVWGYYLVSVGELVRDSNRAPEWAIGINGNPLAGAMGLLALAAMALWLKRRSSGDARSSEAA
jgi:hypothetical protein